MPIIQCPDCGGNVSDKAEACIHCGCPLKKQLSKVIFKASHDVIGLINSYNIMNEKQSVIAKLKPGETYEEVLEADTSKTYYVKLTGNFSSPKEVKCEPNKINRFSVSPGQFGLGCSVARVDMFDSRD